MAPRPTQPLLLAVALILTTNWSSAMAAIVNINGGSMTIDFNANALATETDFVLGGQGPLLVLGRHYTAEEIVNRRLTSGNFNNTNGPTNTGNVPQIRAVVNVGTAGATNWTTDYRIISAQPGYVPPVTTGLQYSIYDVAPSVVGLPLRFPQSSNFSIDSSGNPATATGRIGIGGADAFYFGNNNFLVANAPGTNISFGDYSLSFEQSRVSSSTSGWVVNTHLGVGASGVVAFDTFNTSLTVTPTSFSLSGSLIVASDVTDFTTLRTGANVGSFSLNGLNLTAVPEPSSLLTLAIVGIGGVLVRRRHLKELAANP